MYLTSPNISLIYPHADFKIVYKLLITELLIVDKKIFIMLYLSLLAFVDILSNFKRNKIYILNAILYNFLSKFL